MRPLRANIADAAAPSASCRRAWATRKTTRDARMRPIPTRAKSRSAVRLSLARSTLTLAVQEAVPESVERALPESIHPTGDKVASALMASTDAAQK